MGWHDEAEQGLPPQRHREPAALRQEILDELSDHLALAAERESESGIEDEQQIRKRVLKKFGNPAAIARALWWDAMKETIMKDWIQISINAVICIAVIGFMALFYRQMQTTNTALINALNDRPSAAEDTLPSLEFILHRGSQDGPVIEGTEVRLYGSAFNEELTNISEKSDHQGRATFGPIRAGKYTVRITDEETGLDSTKSITLYSDDGTKTFHLPFPPTKQVPLDITTPLTQNFADTDIRLVMFMRAHWMYEDDGWHDIGKNVIVMSDGIFSVRNYSDITNRFQLDEKITQSYGDRLTFKVTGFAKSYYPQEGGDEWFRRSVSMNGNFSHDLQPDGPNTIVLDLPDILLDRYDYYVRLSANTKHGLPKRFSWFPQAVCEEFTDFTIDEARFVQYSLFLEWSAEQGRYHPRNGGGNESVTDKSGQLFALANAPTSLPDGYKLLLVFRIHSANLRDLDLVDVNLSAYLDTAPISYEFDPPRYNDPPQLTHEPVWKVDANSLPTDSNDVLFVDLTDAVNDDPNFESASGILFKWEVPSKNRILFISPEDAANNNRDQPVWLIMKPIANDAPSNPNAN